MRLSELYSHLEMEFDLDIPEDAEEGLECLRDIRDYLRQAFKEQGMEMPSGAIFERMRRVIAVATKNDSSEIKPETKIGDLVSDAGPEVW